jgi:lipopolysaccharide assembly protein A
VRTILILVLVLAAVIFAVQNADVVTVDVLFWKLDASLAIVVALCVIAGTLLGALISVPRIYRMRAEQRRLRAQLAEVDPSATSELSKAKVRSPQPQ